MSASNLVRTSLCAWVLTAGLPIAPLQARTGIPTSPDGRYRRGCAYAPQWIIPYP